MEARTGIEPVHGGFADPCVTASPPRRIHNLTTASMSGQDTFMHLNVQKNPDNRGSYAIKLTISNQDVVGRRD